MNTRRLVVAAAIAALTAPAALADSGEMRYLGKGMGRNVKINVSGNTLDVFAGEMRHEVRNTTGLASSLNSTLITYCIELTQHVSTNWKPFTLERVTTNGVNPLSAAKESALGDLFAYTNFAIANNQFGNDMAAAFQVAIWEVITDYDDVQGRSSLNITQGDFKASNTNGSPLSAAVSLHLEDMLDAIGNIEPLGILYGMYSSGTQDQIIRIPGVPLPTAAGLGMAGLLTVIGVRRRRPA